MGISSGSLRGLTHLARETARAALVRRAPANPVLFATAGDASGLVSVPDQPGNIYCMLGGDASRTVIALLGTNSGTPLSGSTLALRVLEPGSLSTYVVENYVVGNFLPYAPSSYSPPGGGAGGLTVETPSGTVDGFNSLFTLSSAPSVPASVIVTVNGLVLKQGGGNDFTISTNTITFVSGAIPQSGDTLEAIYFQ